MIYIECYADEVLVTSLGMVKKEVQHASDKGDVCNELEKTKNSKGLIDEDPLTPPPYYIRKLKHLLNKEGIKLLYDKKGQNHIIVLCPRLEEWVLEAVKKAGINIADYGLPDDAYELHKIVNIKLRNFKDLIENIKGKSRMLKTLEGFIRR